MNAVSEWLNSAATACSTASLGKEPKAGSSTTLAGLPLNGVDVNASTSATLGGGPLGGDGGGDGAAPARFQASGGGESALNMIGRAEGTPLGRRVTSLQLRS